MERACGEEEDEPGAFSCVFSEGGVETPPRATAGEAGVEETERGDEGAGAEELEGEDEADALEAGTRDSEGEVTVMGDAVEFVGAEEEAGDATGGLSLSGGKPEGLFRWSSKKGAKAVTEFAQSL